MADHVDQKKAWILGNVPQRLGHLERCIARLGVNVVHSGSDGASLSKSLTIQPDWILADYFHGSDSGQSPSSTQEGLAVIEVSKALFPRADIWASGDTTPTPEVMAQVESKGVNGFVLIPTRFLRYDEICLGIIRRVLDPAVAPHATVESQSLVNDLINSISMAYKDMENFIESSFIIQEHYYNVIERLKEERDQAVREYQDLRARYGELERRISVGAMEDIAEKAEFECSVEAIDGQRGQCAVRVQGMWVPICFDGVLLERHGLGPGMRFTWRFRRTGEICAEDIAAQPLPRFSDDEQAEYDRLRQKYPGRLPSPGCAEDD